jgi:hypothetical protein
MSIIVPTLAVAFAALCVWLGVRVYNRRERWAKWALGVLVGLPVLYVGSFGPACWWLSHPLSNDGFAGNITDTDTDPHAPRIFRPIGWTIAYGPEWLSGALRWYALMGTETVVLPIGPDGAFFIISRH